QVVPVRGARLTPSFSINMGALWSISLSNSGVKYSEKNVERKREFRPRERPIVVVLCSGDSDRLRTNSGQEWEIKTRRRAWRTQTWFTRYELRMVLVKPRSREGSVSERLCNVWLDDARDALVIVYETVKKLCIESHVSK
ncbi:unnamed protein product, partial [Brassica rapa]